MLINLVSNSAAELLPILSFPLNSEELLYATSLAGIYKIFKKSNLFSFRKVNFFSN